MDIDLIVSEIILIGLGMIIGVGILLITYCIKVTMKEHKELEEEYPAYSYSVELFAADVKPDQIVVFKDN